MTQEGMERIARRITVLLGRGSASALALSLASTAWAQSVPEAQPPIDPVTGEPIVRGPENQPITGGDEPPGGGGEIIVTGFRQSLASAINTKRNEAGVVDVIKAEDIADFPDQNLAESLQRIPGVAITRVGGEGRQISVRGLGPEYTRVRVNGMEALATSGGSDSGGAVGNNRSRGFDFNIFASELFSSLVVRKTGSADVEEGSLGATVDLTTGRPFDYREPTFVVSGQLGYNDLSENIDPRVAALATTRLMDDRLGVLVSAAYQERNVLEELHGTTRWGPGGANGGFNAASTVPGETTSTINSNAVGTALFHPRNPSYNSYDQSQKRLGITVGVQYEPTDTTLISFNGLFGRLEGERDESLLQAISFSRSGAGGKPGTIIRDGEVNEDRSLVYGVFDNVDVRSQASHHELTTTFQQYSVDLSQEIGDRLTIDGLVGYANSEFDSPVNTTVTFEALDTDNYSYDYRGGGRIPQISYGFDITDPSSFATVPGNSALNIVQSLVENTFITAKLEGAYELSDALTLKAGGDWREFDFDSVQRQRIAGETDIPVLTPDQLASVSTRVEDYGRGLGLPEGSPTSWLVPDIDAYANLLDIYSGTGLYALGSIEQSDARGANFGVSEEDLGAYVQAVYNVDLFGRPVRGDLGVRYVHTQQNSSGYAAVGSEIQLVTAERSYQKWLPSLNLAFEATETLILRFATAKTLARPSLANLTPGGDISVQGGNRGYSSGNPNLEPTQSTNLDLSIEWYPQQGAVFAVGLFYKDISTFAQTLRTTERFDTLGLPLDLLEGTIALPTDDFEVTRPVNTQGGELKGVEFNVQQPLTFLPGFLRNTGFLANYTYVDSNIEYQTSSTPGAPTVNSTLVGLSKHAANGTLYYEDPVFSLRGSVAYRSGYLTQVPGRNSNFVEGTNSTLNFDARASLNVTEQFQVSLEAINLTDEKEDRYVDYSNRPWVYSHTGRQIFVGARYAF